MTQREASEQEKFNAWWDLKGTNSVILRAQAWSAWLARAEAEQPQPQPAEDPDEWVILDPLKYPDHVLRPCDYISGLGGSWHPASGKSSRLKDFTMVRCRRRDLPKVEQAEQWPKYYKIEDTDIAYMIRLSQTKLKYVYKRGHEGPVWRWSEEDDLENRTEITEAEALALIQKPESQPVPDTAQTEDQWYIWSDDRYPIAFVVHPDGSTENVNVDLVYKASEHVSASHWQRDIANGHLKLVTKDEALAYLKAKKPQKTRVRLFASFGALHIRMPGEITEGIGREVKHDSEGFYVE